MHVAHAGTSEAAILGRVLEPEEATLDVAAARAILGHGSRAGYSSGVARVDARRSTPPGRG